jgi:DNA polymerase-4
LFVIRPEAVEAFLLTLPVGRLPGVGKVTEEKLAKLRIKTVRNILTRSYTAAAPPSVCEELHEIALKLRERVDLGARNATAWSVLV